MISRVTTARKSVSDMGARKLVEIPVLPDMFMSPAKRGSFCSDTAPRKWSEEEISWLLDLKRRGFSAEDIAKSMGRTVVSVSLKLKRLGKKDGKRYNASHVEDKYDCNSEFVNMIDPKSVLDLYAGDCWYKKNCPGVHVESNDTDCSRDTDYHENAEMLVHRLYYERKQYDLVDIDPFGSPFECLDLGIKMASRGLVVTYGEMGHKRFKRLDFVRSRYGIKSLEEFTVEKMIAETVRIGERNKKRLTPVIVRNWNRISRVYYKVEPLKVTEQWLKKNYFQ